jgi:large subunit ribosomal protein L4e
MFAPTKTWRRWHRKVNTNQKRFAVASALAASALPGLVFGRGHIINTVPEIPLVVDSAIEKVGKTKQAIAVLKAVGAFSDVAKARDSRKLRAGKGKMRGRRYTSRRGPLIVYQNDDGLVEAFRNLPGVEVAHVDRLNLLQLAPGGHLGRFIVWSQNAFERMNAIWGSFNRQSVQKKGYTLPRPVMVQSDLTRLINSEEIQSHLRPAIHRVTRRLQKKNPLTNLGARIKLNPYAAVMRRAELLAQERSSTARKAKIEAARKNTKVTVSKEEAAAKKAKSDSEKKHRKVKAANYKRLIAAQ